MKIAQYLLIGLIGNGILFSQALADPSTSTTKHRHHHHHRHHHYRRHVNHKASVSDSSSYVVDTMAPHNTLSTSASTSAIGKTDVSTATTNITAMGSTIDNYAVAHEPRLYSYAALAVNANTGEILVSKNPTAKLPIASISKLMMAMVLLDSGANLDEYVTITPADIDTLRNTYSRLAVGMELKRRDLLLLALMSSENRAAHALGRTAYPGGINVFIQKMNEKARSLGMTHTQFYDPTGLTTLNQSTVEDLVKMVRAAFNYKEIRQDTTTRGADVELYRGNIHHYMNSDALVRAGKLDIDLSKTGFTNQAGHCLVLYSTAAHFPVIMVFLDSSGKNGRILDALAVENYVKHIPH